ncbi:hypothetical protein G3480_25495 [Thiorhodococcus mannitoliphagus]|uniref:ABC-type glycine betaine transport system substrate-binding domain-containing protein n=1 Tax=Thiorhodococcus mannitoliphagus TaxID=329406 RepID=A0A6P1E1C2_9GAMM|nr:glycine betaine ABC transporter substrate-binding protein [Thiorhodococcus mannitoliphagus]NEX23590.1 hypothetical protein [Thiorhodococcus mannitoliphagus]
MKGLRAYLALSCLVVAAVPLLVGCRGASEQVVIGSKKFTESVILGEMLRGLVETTGTPVRHRASLGGTRILFNALVAGEIDAYVEYTGTLGCDQK